MPLSSDPSIRPVPVYWITAGDIWLTILIGVVLIVAAMGSVYWAMRPHLKRGGVVRLEAVESAETVELPPHRPSGLRPTGTVCAPGYRHQTADEHTEFLDVRPLR